LNARRRRLGATDIAAVLGYHPHRTALDVWLEKTGRVTPDPLSGWPIARGNALEKPLLAQWAAQDGHVLADRPPMILAHRQYPHIAASLDGWGTAHGTPVLLEVKTAGWQTRADWWDDTRLLPDHYAIQVLAQLAVTGLPAAHVIADVAGEYRTLAIPQDEAWSAYCLPRLEDWWIDHVIDDTPPDPVVEDLPNLNRVWMPDPVEVHTVSERTQLARDIHELGAVRDRVRELKDRENELRFAIRTAAPTAGTIETTDGRTLAKITGTGRINLRTRNPANQRHAHTPPMLDQGNRR
jgi:putative phage-type endonuclease